jgi:general secretion pathway protein D
MRRWGNLALCLGIAMLAGGCPKGQSDFEQAHKAEQLSDFDDAYVYYQKAVKADPNNANYQIKVNQSRFDAGQMHLQRGYAQRKKGDLQTALSEFQRALLIDPSSSVAEQEIQRTVDLIAEANHTADAAAQPEPETGDMPLATAPPELKPLSNAPINLTMTNDAKMVYDTIAKLAGLTVIYDPDFTAKQIKTNLNNVTLAQALDIVSLQAKAFWKPVTENIIFVIPDQPQKRRDYEEEVVKTFYLGNTVQAQDITEIVTGLRQLLDMKRIQQLNSQNAIIVRDTPDKLALAEKMIRDIDKAKPEVVIEVEVLQARTDRLRDLGILPGQTASIAINPNAGTASTSGTSGTATTTTTNNNLALNTLRHLTGADYSVTLPSLTANAVLTDTYTKIIQNPEIRSIDGQPAKLRVGDKVPVATGSFQAGVGVGSTGGAGIVNPLVNTQFQYLDVGVNVDITPRVHPNHEVSMKVVIEVSSVTGTSTIGGIQQPIISQRKIEHDIRLKEGEVSVLGGLIERTDTKNINGIPGIGEVPLMKYFFSDNSTSIMEDETLIVLTPHILRLPSLSAQNLKPMAAGTDSNVRVYREEASVETPAPAAAPVAVVAPKPAAPSALPAITPTAMPQNTAPAVMPDSSGAGSAAVQLHFEPSGTSMKTGDTATLGLAISNVTDLYSIPLMIHYDPAVIRVEEVRNGGFLSGGTQEIAIVQRIDQQKGEVIVSATRQPNTPGVNGTGTVLGFVIHAVGPGTSHLQILQVNAHNSQQQPIPIVSGEATIQVK